MNASVSNTARLAAAALWLGLAAPGQLPQQQPQQPGVRPGVPTQPGLGTQGEGTVPQPRTGDPDIDRLTPVWSRQPRPQAFQGFPVFPSGLPGYGTYPKSLGELFAELPVGGTSLLPVAPAPPPTGWPGWLKLQSREPLPYQPDRALLVQNCERVWWQDVGEEAMVPLSVFDKLRPVGAGVAVEVRRAGQFELMFHGGSRLLASGPTRLTVDVLDDDSVAVSLQELSWLRLEAFGREHRLTLPDGSTVVVARSATAAAAPTAGAAPPLLPGLMPGLMPGLEPSAGATEWDPALVLLERRDEPGWRSGRATLWNGGGVDLEWRHALGTVTLAPNRRVTLFLEPPRDPVGAALAGEEVVLERNGESAVARAAGAGTVSWCGARFTLGAGAAVRFEAGQGAPFTAAGEAAGASARRLQQR